MKLALFLYCSIIFIESVKADLIMVEVYGQPTTTKKVYSSNGKSWNECMAECYYAQSCVAAWKNGSTCYTFDYWLMGPITQTKEINESIVAFKVENKGGECPSGINPPTFGNKNATGSLYIDSDPKIAPVWVHYNIYYTKGSWKLNYKVDRICGEYEYDGFVSHADSTVTCSFVWYNENTGGFTYSEMKETCDEYSYGMAGFKYKEDVAMFEAKKYLVKIKDTRAYVRVDGIRTAACQKTPKTAYCMSEKDPTGRMTPSPFPGLFFYIRTPTMSPKLHISLLFLLLLIPNAQSSGYLEIRLKSPFLLNATVTITEDIYFPTNKRVFNVPLVPDHTRILTNVPVKFHRPGTVLINSGPVDKFGLHFATIRSDRWNTKQMIIAPDEMKLPFTGFRIDVKCDRNWHGPYCDKFCNDNHAKIINRRCTHNATLGCPLMLSGPNCDVPLLQTESTCPCVNHGYCVSEFLNPLDTVDRSICECGVGFEGEHCEEKEYDYADAIQFGMHGGPEKVFTEFFERSSVDNELRYLYH
ncbi:hypothetical protein B9Z55_013190 [Caenorhabditis nigoni]|uniref:Delta-like protein n=1 Tax=Caenorhabditis nigoni TaxID=1611254 RepID=A0A2G5U0K9_9PELO|nr:hypothetical protein B9Z55_013190 [Caenorhabditis nigoni]